MIIVGGLYFVLWGKNKEMKSIILILDYIEINKIISKDIFFKNFLILSINVF